MMKPRNRNLLTPINAYDRNRTRRLNQAIDETLRDPRTHDAAGLRALADYPSATELAERVRRRAARRGAHVPHLAGRRDALIAAVYALAVPRGWFIAWCDGSVVRTPAAHAGIGILVTDPKGEVMAREARAIASADSFATEIAALAGTLQAGLDAGATRLCVHTDCVALVQLWSSRRFDPRLETVRAIASRLQRVRIRAVPRAHNQAAHALARAAMRPDDERRTLRTD